MADKVRPIKTREQLLAEIKEDVRRHVREAKAAGMSDEEVLAAAREGYGQPVFQKEELLKHYASKEPKGFYQMDVHTVDPGSEDDVMRPDEHGFCFMSGSTTELMRGAFAGVRLLVDPAMPKEKLRLALTKLVRDFDSMFRYFPVDPTEDIDPFTNVTVQ